MYAGVCGCLHTYMWKVGTTSDGFLRHHLPGDCQADQADWPTSHRDLSACLCDLPAFALLALGPWVCTTEPVRFCFVVWFCMGSGH